MTGIETGSMEEAGPVPLPGSGRRRSRGADNKKARFALAFSRLRCILSLLFFHTFQERWLSGRRRRSRKPLTGFSRSGVRIPLSPPSSCSVPSRFSHSSLFPPRRELADGTKFFRTFFPFQFAFFQTGVYIKSHARNCGGVAQLVRVPPCHGGCCGFESRRSRHFCIHAIRNGFFYCPNPG